MPANHHSLDFPVEIWHKIAEHLFVPDLLNLRCVSASTKRLIEANEVWAPLCRSRWFAEDSADLDKLYAVRSGYLDYYKQRHALDVEVVRALQKRPFMLRDGWKVATLGEDVVPVLVRMKRSKEDLTTRYYAASVLDVIRRRLAVDKMRFYLSEEGKDALLEDVFYDLCLFDREFDTLVSYRRKILEGVKQSVRDHVIYEQCATATSKVVLIATQLASEINKVVDQGYTDHSLENFSVLRFYAGETEGTQSMHYAVIQKIASEFGIESHVTSAFLAVKDDTYRAGVSYISLKRDLHKPKVFKLSDIYDFVRRTNSTDPMGALNDLTRPLTIREHLEEKLDFRRVHSLAHGWELLQGSYMYRDTYPCSKNHIQSSIADYYALCFLSMQKNTNLSEFAYLAAKFPFDAAFIDDELLQNTTLGFKLDAISSFSALDRVKPCDRFLISRAPPLRIGQIVLHAVGYYSVIVGYSTNSEELFYSLLNGLEARASRVSLVPKEDITAELVDLLTNDYKAGIYFTQYDQGWGAFIPTRELQRAYPNL